MINTMVASCVIAGLGLVSTWLVARLRWEGWALAVFSQLLWFTYALTTGQLGFLVSSSVFFVVNIRTAYRWRRSRPDRAVPEPTRSSTTTSDEVPCGR